jgi:hypothetical protein
VSVRRQPEPPPRKPPHYSPSRFRQASKWSAANRSTPDSARDQILSCTFRSPTARPPRGNGQAPAAAAQTSRSRQSMSARISRKKFQLRAQWRRELPSPRQCAPSRSPELEQPSQPQARELVPPAKWRYQAPQSARRVLPVKAKLIATAKLATKTLMMVTKRAAPVANFVPAPQKPAPHAPVRMSTRTIARSTQSPHASRSARVGRGAASETPRCPLSTFGPPSRLPCRSFPRERKPQAPVGSNSSLSASL